MSGRAVGGCEHPGARGGCRGSRAGGRRGPVVRWWMGEQQGQAGRRRDAEVARGGATGAEKMRVCLV